MIVYVVTRKDARGKWIEGVFWLEESAKWAKDSWDEENADRWAIERYEVTGAPDACNNDDDWGGDDRGDGPDPDDCDNFASAAPGDS